MAVATASAALLSQVELPVELVGSEASCTVEQRPAVCSRQRSGGIDSGAALLQHDDATEVAPTRVPRVEAQEGLFCFLLISYSGYLYTRQSISEKDPRELIPLVMFIDLTRESLAPSLEALGLSMRDS